MPHVLFSVNNYLQNLFIYRDYFQLLDMKSEQTSVQSHHYYMVTLIIILCSMCIKFPLYARSMDTDAEGTLLPVQDIFALHSRMEGNPSIDFIYTFFETTHLFDTYFSKITDINRKPDYIVLFNGVGQTDEWGIFDTRTKKIVDTILQEGIVCVIMFDDNPNEHYSVELRAFPPFSSQYSLADRVTSLFSPNNNTTVYLSNEPLPNIPHYFLRAQYFRLPYNSTIEPSIIPLPGEDFHRDYIGMGLCVGLSSRDKPRFLSFDDKVLTLAPSETEIFPAAALGVNLFLGRDPLWTYNEMPWQSRFYKRFWSRLSMQGGIVFTRSREFLGHYIAGLGIRVFRRGDLVIGTLLTTQPTVGNVSTISSEDSWRADQLVPSERIALPYVGLTMTMFEF